jgi:hypothetical protein
MKAYLDELVEVGVLTTRQSEYNDEVTFYKVNDGYQITMVQTTLIVKTHIIDEFEYDADDNEVLTRTTSPAIHEEWDNWFEEFTIYHPDCLTINRIAKVTLADLKSKK